MAIQPIPVFGTCASGFVCLVLFNKPANVSPSFSGNCCTMHNNHLEFLGSKPSCFCFKRCKWFKISFENQNGTGYMMCITAPVTVHSSKTLAVGGNVSSILFPLNSAPRSLLKPKGPVCMTSDWWRFGFWPATIPKSFICLNVFIFSLYTLSVINIICIHRNQFSDNKEWSEP